MTTTTVDRPVSSVEGSYRLHSVIRMEWRKLRSVRSTWWTLAVFAAGMVGLAILVGLKTPAHPDPSYDPTEDGFAGLAIGQLALGILGVLALSTEFTSGSIRATFAAAPRRLRVLAAKAAVLGAVALITGEAAAFLSFCAGGMTLRHGITAPALSQPGVLRAIVLTGASLTPIALLGLGLGAIIRHTAAAITVVAGIVCAGGPLNLAIRPYLPIYIVSHSLSATTPLCRPGAASCWLSAWSGLGMLAIYAAIAMVLGALILTWRDA